MTTINTGTLAYRGAAFGRPAAADPLPGPAASSAGQKSNSTGATNVTLSDAARALLAAQNSSEDFAAVTAAARGALDDLYKMGNVASPLEDGKLAADLSDLDRREVFAIASNSENRFTADEQAAAAQELQNRFDAAMRPVAAAAELVGDYSSLYQAALAYFDGMSDEEKAAPGWADGRSALAAGYRATQQNPAVLPQGIPGDPIAAFIARNTQAGDADTATDFSGVAESARQALDEQYDAAKTNGTTLVFDSQRRNGRLADFSDFGNQSLSAVSLNQDHLFSAEESYAAKRELGARTRESILRVFQQGGSNGDPRAFSLGLIQQYQTMSPEERQAAGLSSSFLDLAVQNYKSAASLMSILSQANTGTSILDYIS